MPDLTGQSIGRYHIIEPLGEGGMAAVYKAYDTRLEHEVAIKVLLPSRQQNELFIMRFEREARLLQELDHPQIASLFDFGHQDHHPYLVTDYLPGGSLKTRLGSPMHWREAAHLLATVARALDHAHGQHILHRDLKPSNLLFNAAGKLIVSDLGIAGILEGEDGAALTGMKTGFGTPQYRAPEQGMGRAVDGRADIYALGVMLYEMLTGKGPFPGGVPGVVLYQQMAEPIPSPSMVCADLPPEMEVLVYRAMAREAGDRFQDCGEMAEVLETAARGRLIVRRPQPAKGAVKEPKGTEALIKKAALIRMGLLLVILLGLAVTVLMIND